ncbi:hypothetical protein EDB86DRAFT_3241702 [Lactarius hatsudake]|nr:hypothetical protein EDB86DRAFT_3241702 [Lactarius hatsudake]
MVDPSHTIRRRSDVERQQRFYSEFEVYLSLEIAYQSGQLRDRITPHCYGAFEGGRTDVLILGLCGDTLKGWNELNFSEQTQVYGLVWDLHRAGMVHGDLEPWNIARVPGGGFRLIDFSESVRHTCVEISGKSNKRYNCSELQAMRDVLKLLQRHASRISAPPARVFPDYRDYSISAIVRGRRVFLQPRHTRVQLADTSHSSRTLRRRAQFTRGECGPGTLHLGQIVANLFGIVAFLPSFRVLEKNISIRIGANPWVKRMPVEDHPQNENASTINIA